MKTNLILLILFLLIISCDNDEKVYNPINLNYLKVYRDNILTDEYTYTDDNRLLKKVSYNNDGSYYDSCVYKYLDDNSIDYMLKYSTYSTNSSEYIFVYDNNLLTQIQREINYSIFYDNDQRINKIELEGGGCDCDYSYEYNADNNIDVLKFTFPPGFIIDSMKYDDKINPLSKLFHYKVEDTRYISTNNITYQKHYRKDYMQSDLGDIKYEISEEIKHFQYEYNEDGMPITMIEFNQTTNDTMNYRFEYE